MRTIHIIDESVQFRDYMRQKIEENNLEVSTAANAAEGVSKMKNLHPDLIILDYHLGHNGYMTVLKEKSFSQHDVKTPVILLTQQIDRRKILELVPYNVRKVFTKPVKIDALFATISEILAIPLKLDKTPSIVEAHVNEDIIFIEIAQGLNEDKLDLLKFKILELIDLYEIRVPKVIIMFANIKLTHADAPNMMKLIETVIHASRARLSYIKILTRDEFVTKFLSSMEEYKDIVVVDQLETAMDGLLAGLGGARGNEEERAAFMGERVLSSTGSAETESVGLRFEAESQPRTAINSENLKKVFQNCKIASVDDDFVMRDLIKNTFESLGAEVKTYAGGKEYLMDTEQKDFDLIFLDLVMPELGGLEVLQVMQSRGIDTPVIVLSSITQRETVIRAFKLGIKSYLSKPLKPADVFKKATEILLPSV